MFQDETWPALRCSDGARREIALEPKSVADFYAELMSALDGLGLGVRYTRGELSDAAPFAEDRERRSYDAEYGGRFWRVLVQTDRVMKAFRARFRGKSSPVHFFWGNMDLALTRFSGRRAPPHPGGRPHLPDEVLRDAYSDECIEFGFWPGEEENPDPVFFCLAYPQPPGFQQAALPAPARYSKALKELVLFWSSCKAVMTRPRRLAAGTARRCSIARWIAGNAIEALVKARLALADASRGCQVKIS